MNNNQSHSNKKKQKDKQQKTTEQASLITIQEEQSYNEKIEECSSIVQNLDVTDTDNKEIQEIMAMILSRINEMGSKSSAFSDNNQLLHIRKELIKSSLEKNIQPMINQSLNYVHLIKKEIKGKCEKSIRKLIQKEKGLYYITEFILEKVIDFQRYYDYIIPFELRSNEQMNFMDALNNIYYCYSINKHGSIHPSLNDDLSALLQALHDENILIKGKRRINLKISGLVKRLNKDEVIVELADIVPYLNRSTVSKTIKKALIVSKLLYEMIMRQFPSIEQIDLFCNVYYARKDKDIVMPEYEDNVGFCFINYP